MSLIEARRPGRPYGYVRSLGILAWFGAMWAAWFGFNVTYVLIRAAGDDLSRPRDVSGIESNLPGPALGPWLQEALFRRDFLLLDQFSFVMHGFWFGVPFAFGMVLMIYQRRSLLEYLTWTAVLFHVAAFIFLVCPVRPPWMDGDVVRVLDARDFYAGKTTVDNNPFAAMPSLHAALPAITAIYFFIRGSLNLRFYAWLATAYTAAVSFAIVYLGEHWVIDVLGGYAVAALAAWLCMSDTVRRLYVRIPGDPVGLLARINSGVCAPAPSRHRELPNDEERPADPSAFPRAA